MPSTIRLATEEDSRLAISMSERMTDEMGFKAALHGEREYGFKVVSSNAGIGFVQVLMPSGHVFVRDLLETGNLLDSTLSKSQYSGDRSMEGELGHAVVYSSVVGRAYLKMQGFTT